MSHPIDVEIGRRIRDERVSAGFTQKQLSALIGVKFQQLQKYETAANRVSGSRLWLIAKALSVPVSCFMPDDAEISVASNETEPGNARLMRDILRLEPRLRREVARFVHAISTEPGSDSDQEIESSVNYTPHEGSRRI
ncbi:MAG: helix-turn-helix transcriptional regulator [Pseudomonadota bacterium]|jgi:transcriptional regulator with XRE-family HTH domain|nr:helix-turn-helix transcriptional regulator [Pseudomonadota bacterium]